MPRRKEIVYHYCVTWVGEGKQHYASGTLRVDKVIGKPQEYDRIVESLRVEHTKGGPLVVLSLTKLN